MNQNQIELRETLKYIIETIEHQDTLNYIFNNTIMSLFINKKNRKFLKLWNIKRQALFDFKMEIQYKLQ